MKHSGSGRARVGVAVAAATAVVTALCGTGVAAAAPVSAPAQASGIVGAPTLIAHTRDGDVGYREVGTGSPILLVMGHGASMDAWAPAFVDALAAHHTVVVFDNAGVGQTSALPGTMTVPAMAEQTSALISVLRLHRPTVLGWSLGGMVAQALAVRHPGQVGRLVLASTQAGTGEALPIPPAAAAALDSPDPAVRLSVLFPSDQLAAAYAYAKGISQYPGFYGVSDAVRAEQATALQEWMAGADREGREVGRIHVPVLVADGASDALDPAGNATILADGLRCAHVLMYPDAGHAFLFQDPEQFAATVDAFAS